MATRKYRKSSRPRNRKEIEIEKNHIEVKEILLNNKNSSKQ